MNTAGYTKLLSRILVSSIWQEPDYVVRVWITMLAMCDKDGFVAGSPIGLSHIAKKSIDETLSALEKFKSPDQYSTTKDNKGRRIQEVDGGWVILNFKKIRDEQSKEDRRVYDANWHAEKKKKIVSNTEIEKKRNSTNSIQAEAEAEAEAEADKRNIDISLLCKNILKKPYEKWTSEDKKFIEDSTVAFALKYGFSADVGREIFLEYDRVGWKDAKGQPIQDLEALVKNWKKL